MSSFISSTAFVRLPAFLAVAGLVAFTACQSDRGSAGSVFSPDGEDGFQTPPASFDAHGDWDDDDANRKVIDPERVHLLRPVNPVDPTGDESFDQDLFDKGLTVLIAIYECDNEPGEVATATDCPSENTEIVGGDPSHEIVIDAPAPLSDDETHYIFPWDSPKKLNEGKGKNQTKFKQKRYRAFFQVVGFEGGDSETTIAHADVILAEDREEADDSADPPLFNAGQSIPFKVMIEEGCQGIPNQTECSRTLQSPTTEDVLIEFEDTDLDGENDFTLFFPEGTEFTDTDGNALDAVTFELSLCDQPFDADLKIVGPCYTVLTFVDGVQTDILLSPDATVSICDLNDPSEVFASDDQEGLVSIIHFENGEFAEALAHEEPIGCDVPPVISSAHPLVRLAGAVGERVVGWIAPKSARAASALVLDTGGGGSTGGFSSNFQGALPSAITVGPNFPTDENNDPEPQTALVGASVSPAPVVKVVDANGEPVQGAFVRFQVLGTSSNATVDDKGDATDDASADDFVRIQTDADGLADARWVLNDTDNPHLLDAFAWGMTAGDETDVLQPVEGNEFFGGASSVDPVFGGLFCDDEECAGVEDPAYAEDWIIAESITFEANAGQFFGALQAPDNNTALAQFYLVDPVEEEAFLFFDGNDPAPTNMNSPNGLAWDGGTGRLYFSAETQDGSDLWFTDGSTATNAGALVGLAGGAGMFGGDYYYVVNGEDDLKRVSFDAGGTIALAGITDVCPNFTGDDFGFRFGDLVVGEDETGHVVLYGSTLSTDSPPTPRQWFSLFIGDLDEPSCDYQQIGTDDDDAATGLQLACGAEDGFVYGASTGSGDLVTIDPTTGQPTLAGNVLVGGQGFTDLAGGECALPTPPSPIE